ncbi:MAG: hypothetical protein AB8C84_02730 [Oligoflexales bacterium]
MMDISAQKHEHTKTPAPTSSSGFRDCCMRTVRDNAKFNPMMVCAECKYLIKCFTDDAAYRNYLKFCASRGRQVEHGMLDSYRVTIFKAFDQYR